MKRFILGFLIENNIWWPRNVEMCRPRVGEANPLFSVCRALWRPTVTASKKKVVRRQRNLGLLKMVSPVLIKASCKDLLWDPLTALRKDHKYIYLQWFKEITITGNICWLHWKYFNVNMIISLHAGLHDMLTCARTILYAYYSIVDLLMFIVVIIRDSCKIKF
jgi:hypothetical protein